MLALIVAMTAAQLSGSPKGPIFFSRPSKNSVFARVLTTVSASDECTGAAISGLSVARTSSAFCTKSDGTMVLLGANVPRLEADGVLVEGAGTNLVLRSQELDNAAWTPQSVTAAAPTITANVTAAPDGTTTAERIQIPAVSGAGALSRILQFVSVGSAVTVTVYLKGVSGSGSTYLWMETGGAPPNATLCTYDSNSYTRCSYSANSSGSMYFMLGTQIGTLGMTSTAAADFFAWGAQVEATAYATSYVATAGTTAVRTADNYSIPATGFPSTASGLCLAASYRFIGTSIPSTYAILDYGVDNNNRIQFTNAFGNSGLCDILSTTGNATMGAVAGISSANNQVRQICRWNGSGTITRVYPGAADLSATNVSASNFTPTTITVGKNLAFATGGTPRRIMNIQFAKTANGCN